MPVPPAHPHRRIRCKTGANSRSIRILRIFLRGTITRPAHNPIAGNSNHASANREVSVRLAEADTEVDLVVIVSTEVPSGVTDLFEKLQLAYVGRDPQLTVTALPKFPPTEDSVSG